MESVVQIGSLDLSWIDIAIIVGLVIVVVWAALKLVTRLVLGLVIVVVLAALFMGVNFQEFGLRLG